MISTRSITSATAMDQVLNSLLSVQGRVMSDARQFAIISNALDEALEYFKRREDADHNGVDFVPNEAMRLALEIEQAQAALASLIGGPR